MAATNDRDTLSHDDADVARRAAAAAGRRPRSASASARDWSATAILADAGCRAIVRALGDGERVRLSAAEVHARAHDGIAPRLVRDRIRELDRAGFLTAVDTFPVLQWSLTPAGRDLHRLLSVIERIVSRAAGLGDDRVPGAHRDRAIERTLRALGDPVVQQVLAALAGDAPVGPVTLEERCRPTPRRTLYRRLQEMVDTGVVLRDTSIGVPRTSTYAFAPGWRHAAVLGMLPAWWESRRHQPHSRSHVLDIEIPVLILLPTVRAARLPDGARVRWAVEYEEDRADILLEACGERLVAAADGGAAGAEVVGTPAGWAAALISDRPDALEITGDASLARGVADAVRAELLAYVL